MRFRHLLVSVLASFAATVAPASAQTDCVAPPGNAAIEQYCESIPAATGDKGGGATAPQPLDRDGIRELRAEGEDGAALAQLLETDGRRPAGGAAKRKAQAENAGRGISGKSGSDAVASFEAPSSNPLSAVSTAVEAGPTLGGPFGWAILGLSTLLIAAGWMHYRSRRN